MQLFVQKQGQQLQSNTHKKMALRFWTRKWFFHSMRAARQQQHASSTAAAAAAPAAEAKYYHAAALRSLAVVTLTYSMCS
jgi:hypothetical protein